MTASWPTPATYQKAVQVPRLLHPELQTCTFQIAEGTFGGQLPRSFAGANAIVFPVDAEDTSWGIRFFTNRQAAVADRYAALDRFQQQTTVSSLAGCRWMDEGVRIDNAWFPALQMEWINGVMLDQYIVQLAGGSESAHNLHVLADDWRQLVAELQNSGIAHGDLQHGNVLIDQRTNALRLVDFDGIWLEELDTSPPAEAGHPAYQHPARMAGLGWGRFVDTFAGLVVFLTLKALATDASLLGHIVIGSNLVLASSDYEDVAETPSPVLQKLLGSSDPYVAGLAELLVEFLARSDEINVGLEHALGGVSNEQPTVLLRRPDLAETDTTSTDEWWHSAATGTAIGPIDAPTDPTEIPRWEFRHFSSSPSGSRPLPDHETISRQFGDSEERAAEPTESASWWTESSTSVPRADATHIERTVPSNTDRMIAFVIDIALGVLVIPLMLSLRSGSTAGKRVFGLFIIDSDDRDADVGRIILRELILKLAFVVAFLVGLIAGRLELVALAAVWFILSAALAFGDEHRRPLWDLIAGTRVVQVRQSSASSSAIEGRTSLPG